jgi:regulator of protease activity HflC (stomatin/prohibitin superfamily)
MTVYKGLIIGIVAIITITIAMFLWATGASLVSQPNDVAVAAGLTLLIATAAGVIVVGASLVRYIQKPAKSVTKKKTISKRKESGAMKKLSLLLLLLMVAVPMLTGGCTRVDPGYVGIKVNLYGSDKGVEDLPLVTGRVWYNPWSTDIYVFPTFMQTVTWTQSKTEESPNDDSITFNSIEGAVLNTDVSIAYTFEAAKVPNIFKEFRQPAKDITWKYMRSQIRDAFSRHASQMKAVDIFGSRKQELLIAVKKDLNDYLGPKGFHFDMISLVGAIRADDNVKKSINAVIEAAQKAIEAENKVRESTAIANQKIESARGEGESVLVVAKKQAEANDVLTKSITPTLIQWETLKKWNGVLPQVTSGAVPFVTIPSGK